MRQVIDHTNVNALLNQHSYPFCRIGAADLITATGWPITTITLLSMLDVGNQQSRYLFNDHLRAWHFCNPKLRRQHGQNTLDSSKTDTRRTKQLQRKP